MTRGYSDKDINLPSTNDNKQRLLIISGLAVFVAAATSGVARLLIYLIDFFTNIVFYGNFSSMHNSPASNSLGIYVIFIPVLGGLVVGLMALYGSKAIRGHGIPEAMEQILTNQSKIKPSITILKPLSAAISIGTGGPFGAEGPIISTGGALGSTFGQILKITHYERKILLAAGATAGMSAIFGTPLAAIFLAIELLLFEFSPRSIIPIALACITGAAGHHFLFESGPVFPVHDPIEFPGNSALAMYSLIGILIGLLSVLVTKAVYFIEDGFEKLPIHWALWPAMGGIVVGLVGYFAPRTLGVGYENIIGLLAGSFSLQVILSLFILKFVSWAIALGSGTSGGTLAPLLTIGGAAGALFGNLIINIFPESGITVPLAALIGMSAMFAGASRAVLTSIIFGLETTAQSNALLPLLAACAASYFVSFFIMKNTIMTEKIARRGVKTPHSYESDILERVTVGQIMKPNGLVLDGDKTIHEVRSHITISKDPDNYFIVATKGEFSGVVSASSLFDNSQNSDNLLSALTRQANVSVDIDQSLRTATEIMAKEKIYVLVVSGSNDKSILGTVSYRDIIDAIQGGDDHELKNRSISLQRHALKIMIRGKNLIKRDRS
jgi:H+/Cl- antiporter ClcA